MWLIFASITVLLWGTSETIFKKVSTEEDDSILKLIAYNGIILGISAFCYMLITKTTIDLKAILTYLPIALLFIASMFCTYAAMRLVKISIVSPLQNSSCAITCILCITLLKQDASIFQLVSIIVIISCIILLSINKSEITENKEKSYKTYLIGIGFAIGYWLLDGIGSFCDDYILGEELSAEQLNVVFPYIYGFVGLICLAILKIVKKEKVFNILEDKKKFIGTLIESAGQYTYVYAVAFGDAVLTAPFIASYSIVTLILSRIFLKEKLNKKQYILIALMLCGMIILSI